MVDYICDAYEPPRDQYGYEPICPFPYLPAGWKMDHMRDGSYGNLTMNDCSVTWASTTDGRYARKCMTYFVLSAIPGAITMFYLYILNHNKHAKDKGKKNRPNWIIDSLIYCNLSEQLCWLNVMTAITHCLMAIDIDGWSTTIPLSWKQLLMALNISALISFLVILVTAWVTIVEGGKSRGTPRWCYWANRMSIGATVLAEVVCGQVQAMWGKPAYYDVYTNGKVIIIKWTVNVIVSALWGILAYIYGLKISKQLKSNSSKVSPEVKRIKKFCYTAAVLSSAAVVWRLIPLLQIRGQDYTYYGIPPCKFTSSSFINNFIVFMQFGVVYAQQPGQKKATTRAMEAIKSTIFTGGRTSTNRTSTNATGKGSSKASSKGSSNPGSTNASSANSSTNSSTTSSSIKASSVVPSDLSDVSAVSSVVTDFESGADAGGESEYSEIELAEDDAVE